MAKILIAEDEKISQTVLKKIVEGTGHTPIVCDDGQIAWDEISQNEDIILVITDMKMPNLSGEQLIGLLRQKYTSEELPIIVISAFIPLGKISDVMDLGATMFLPKPLNRKDIQDGIQQCLQQWA